MSLLGLPVRGALRCAERSAAVAGEDLCRLKGRIWEESLLRPLPAATGHSLALIVAPMQMRKVDEVC